MSAGFVSDEKLLNIKISSESFGVYKVNYQCSLLKNPEVK